MKKVVLVAMAAVTLALAGCGGTRQENTVGGAVLGGAAGAALGAAATGRAGGALVGGAIGAVAGAAVGNAQPAAGDRVCIREGYDAYGNLVCTRYAVRR